MSNARISFEDMEKYLEEYEWVALQEEETCKRTIKGCSPADFINCSMLWDDTTEGQDFWEIIFERLKTLEEFDND